ncbi:MAG: conjugal transfer protein TraX, partial [Oscillospiraceae bacterium]|nr:conjugal transfer protein TraX [Oscillospiraceae bacterium]
MQKQLTGGISLITLHLLAMAFMLCDSLCLTFAQDSSLLQFAGRLAYPVFAFMVVEGYFYT